jgi:hypothetical protein
VGPSGVLAGVVARRVPIATELAVHVVRADAVLVGRSG